MALLEAKVGKHVPAPRPDLRVVATPAIAPVSDAVTRESHMRMIRSLLRNYRRFGMDLIVNQALMGRGELDDLDDEDLATLHADMRRGLDCIENDVPFHQAGLLRGN